MCHGTSMKTEASIIRTEVSGSTKEQAVVEKHNAAIRILPAVA